MLALRLPWGGGGHDESRSSLNRGNFREIFSLLANHDIVIEERLECGPQNATYLSPEIQNLLLKIMGNMMRKSVADGVKRAGYFSLLADETKDTARKSSWQ